MEAVKIDNVSFKYKVPSLDDSRPFEELMEQYAVKNVSLTVNEGEFVAILGHNGSGKSTLAKLLNGLLIPESGDITIFSKNTRDADKLFEIRKSIGMVFQNPDNQMIATIVEDDIAFGPENIGVEPAEINRRVDWALECVNMEGFRQASSSRLSGGQKQRIAIAGVLAVKPRILVLDESTAMLDPLGRAEVLSVIEKLNKEQNMTVILITHFMDEAALAGKVFVFNDGELVLGGKPAEVFKNYDYLKSIGLSVPFASGVAKRLYEGGIDIDRDNILTTEELYKAICRLL